MYKYYEKKMLYNGYTVVYVCDSTVTLDLTINYSSSYLINDTATAYFTIRNCHLKPSALLLET